METSQWATTEIAAETTWHAGHQVPIIEGDRQQVDPRMVSLSLPTSETVVTRAVHSSVRQQSLAAT